MIVSRCCKSEIFVQDAHEGKSYHVCENCHRACDPIQPNVSKFEVISDVIFWTVKNG